LQIINWILQQVSATASKQVKSGNKRDSSEARADQAEIGRAQNLLHVLALSQSFYEWTWQILFAAF
jgi:hypothetical protein